ncbi:MAG TPA: adenylate/guanylate cyclase domain-containing protein [Mycobacteriales bacterium]|nr:adenylate/guanylate cyclase domain-containing protein [Mycobacteriales bacterium]
MEEDRAAGGRRRLARLQALDRHEGLVEAVRRARHRLPGDSAFGDPLSSTGRDSAATLARLADKVLPDEPRTTRELGLGALQLWQAALVKTGRGRGDREVTILFTDLVGFSSWALQVGDDQALVLLRRVASAIEPPVAAHRGKVVKRLGDGVMAVFPTPQTAWDALCAAQTRLGDVDLDGYEPRLRAGLHTGRPRAIGGDYLGVDVTIAARLVEKASADEVLVSETTLWGLDRQALSARRKKTFAWRSVKGVPAELGVFSVRTR